MPRLLVICAAAIIASFLGVSFYFSEQRLENAGYKSYKSNESSYAIKIEKERSFSDVLNADPIAHYTKVLAYATMVLAGFTILLAVVTVLIWLDGKAAAKRQHKASRRSNMNAARSAKAAINAADAAQKSVNALTSAERAHIRFQQVKIDPSELFDFDPAKHGAFKRVEAKISWVLENHGKTPADVDDCMVDLWVGRRAVDQDFIPAQALFQQTIPGGKQSDENIYTKEIITSRALCNALIRKQDFIRAEIYVFYYDIFGQRQREHVRWRYDSFTGGPRFPMIERDD